MNHHSLRQLPAVTRYLPALIPLALFILLLQHVPGVSAGQPVTSSWSWVPALGVSLAWRLDGFSLMFSLLITGIGTLVTVYAIAYFADAPSRTRIRFVSLILLFMMSMLGTVLSDNLMAMFVFWEATSLLSFLLIGFESHKASARKAAWQSLLVTGSGGLALFAGIVLIGQSMGTFALSELAARAPEWIDTSTFTASVVLIMVGAFTKSAQFPFHFWLPQAMAAPTPASAYLHSATMVKLGVYLVARVDPIVSDVAWFGQTLLAVGMLTMLIAAIHAVRATGYKAVLAHSTVGSLGILVMLIGLSGPAATLAMCAFLLAHALYKAALFFCAGTAIHATHISELRRLGGLARALPWTATAAVVASLSMAGLPPMAGFIAKELLFEAQLDQTGNVLPVVVAVLVNGVMVAIAAVVVWRPFFARPAQALPIRHGETPGLLAGPITLATCGAVVGLWPGGIGQYVLAPAASALFGAPITQRLELWHGFTPMLGLSAIVVSLGGVLAWRWDTLHHRLTGMTALNRVDANQVYQSVVNSVLSVARRSTAGLQNGDHRRYVLVTALTLIAVTVWTLWRTGGALEVSSQGTLLWLPATLLLLGVIGAVVAARTQGLLLALVGVGVVGYGSALFFLLHGAPDLALTQFAVETLVLIVLMAVMVRLPNRAAPTRAPRERRVDALVAAAFGILVFIALGSMLAQPFDSRLSDFFGLSSLAEAHGRNVVNVIIVDYRAFDTMGEIAVVAFATLGIWSLLRRRRPRPKAGTPSGRMADATSTSRSRTAPEPDPRRPASASQEAAR